MMWAQVCVIEDLNLLRSWSSCYSWNFAQTLNHLFKRHFCVLYRRYKPVYHPEKHQSEFYNAISDEMFESYYRRRITEVLGEEKGGEDRLVLVRTGQIRFILHLRWCIRRTAGLYLYGRDLDKWKEEATAFESLLNSAQGVWSEVSSLRSRMWAECACEGSAGAEIYR